MSEQAQPEHDRLDAGARIAGYRILAKIGQGGMAVVFRAHDERLDRTVALKLLEQSLASDEAFRLRFIRESRAAAAVDDPHIIPVFEAGEANGVLFIAMRFVPGGDVLSLAGSDGRLAVGRAVEITSQAASALDAAHARGLVHRDVKPANMLVDPGEAGNRADHVYLSDFGLSKWALQNTGLTGTGMFLGTVDYSAPEQIEGKLVDGRADQYSLACAAFQLLTGTAPFHRPEVMAAMFAHVREPPPALTSRRPDLPSAVDAVFARALAKAADDRYPMCRDFAGALRVALGLTGTPGPARKPEPVTIHPAAQVLATPAAIPDTGPTPVRSNEANAWAATPPEPQPVPGGIQPVPWPPPGWPPAGPDRRPRLGAVALIGASVLIAAGLVAAALVFRPPSAGPSALRGSSTSPSVSAGITTPASRAPSSPASPGSVSTAKGSSPGAGSGQPGASVGQDGFRLSDVLSSDSADGDTSITWNPAGTILAASNKDGSIYLWSPATDRSIGPELAEPGKALAAAFSPDGTELAAGYDSGWTYLWNVRTGGLIASVRDPGSSALEQVDSVAFSPDGRTLVTSDGNGRANLWAVSGAGRRLTFLTSLRDPSGVGVYSAVFSSTGTLATGDYDGYVYLWDTTTGSPTATFSLPGGGDCGTAICSAISGLSFSADGSVLAASNESGNVELWNVTAGLGNPLALPPKASGLPVWAVAFDSGNLLALACDDGTTYLYQVGAAGSSGSLAGALTDTPAGSQGVGALGFSPNGTYLVTGDTNGNTNLWHQG
jgi:serine/threonine protein kinase